MVERCDGTSGNKNNIFENSDQMTRATDPAYKSKEASFESDYDYRDQTAFEKYC